MSRPKNPTWIVEPWAEDSLYQAGPYPWSGTPTKVAPSWGATTGVAPRMAFSAQSWNYTQNKNASHDQAAKDLLDALVDFVGQAPILNFDRASTAQGAANFTFYDPAKRKLYAVGNVENVRESLDFGLTWSGSSLVASVGADEDCIHGAADTSGSIVVATSLRYAFERNGSTGTWTKVDVAGAAMTAGIARVVYDPIRARWIWGVANATTGNFLFKHSADRTTWTTATTPPATTLSVFDLAVKPSTGKAMMVRRTSDTSFAAHVSTDGGIVWASAASVTMSTSLATANSRAALAYNAASDLWIWTMASNTNQTQVWISSTDGASWTQVSNLSATRIYNVACLGELWAGVTDIDNAIVYSTDRGTTWRHAGVVAPSGTLKGIAECAGGFVVTTTSSLYYGSRAGRPDVGVLA